MPARVDSDQMLCPTAPPVPTPDAIAAAASAWPDCMSALVVGIRRLAMQSDLSGVAAVAAESAAELARATRARCYFVHADQALLWTADGEEFPVSTGLVGEAACARAVRTTPRAGLVPSYCQPVDDPEGDGTERLLAQPIVAPSGEIHAVVVVVRSAALPEFSTAEVALLGSWSAQVAPLFHLFHVEGQVAEAELGLVDRRGIYREEAVEHILATAEDLGVIVGHLPAWLRHCHWLAVVVVLVGLVLLFAVDITEHATGPAFIVSSTDHDVVAGRAGVVRSVHVQPGDRVRPGQLLATLGADAERAELVRSQAELDRALLDRLRDPSDRMLEVAVAQARAERRRATAHIEQTNVRASQGGRVGDVRIEPGRPVTVGQALVTIADDQAHAPVVRALVPGRYRPAIEAGQPLALEIDGFSNATQRLTVLSVSQEVLGASEIARVIGPGIADAFEVVGPVVIVEARLDAPHLDVDGRTWTVHEGMVGRASVDVRRRPIAFVLFPGLERLLNDV